MSTINSHLLKLSYGQQCQIWYPPPNGTPNSLHSLFPFCLDFYAVYCAHCRTFSRCALNTPCWQFCFFCFCYKFSAQPTIQLKLTVAMARIFYIWFQIFIFFVCCSYFCSHLSLNLIFFFVIYSICRWRSIAWTRTLPQQSRALVSVFKFAPHCMAFKKNYITSKEKKILSQLR